MTDVDDDDDQYRADPVGADDDDDQYGGNNVEVMRWCRVDCFKRASKQITLKLATAKIMRSRRRQDNKIKASAN